jgi:hypothetical protein
MKAKKQQDKPKKTTIMMDFIVTYDNPEKPQRMGRAMLLLSELATEASATRLFNMGETDWVKISMCAKKSETKYLPEWWHKANGKLYKK